MQNTRDFTARGFLYVFASDAMDIKQTRAGAQNPASQSEREQQTPTQRTQSGRQNPLACVLSELHGIAHKHRRRSLMCSLA